MQRMTRNRQTRFVHTLRLRFGSDQAKRPATNVAQKYSAALRALYSSNQILEKKMSKLRASTIRLNLDLMKLQRHMSTMQHDFLTTWQADILTLLIEVVFARCHRVLPGGYAVEEIESLDYETLTRVYRTAAKRIQKERLRRNFGLSAKYYFALQKYWEVRILLVITLSSCFLSC